MGEKLAREAKAPTDADREKARKAAKVMDEDGKVHDPQEEIAELKAKIKHLKGDENKGQEILDPSSYLDQNTRTVVKKVKAAAKKRKLKKKDVEALIEAEAKGNKRVGVLDKLRNFVKNDKVFSKFVK